MRPGELPQARATRQGCRLPQAGSARACSCLKCSGCNRHKLRPAVNSERAAPQASGLASPLRLLELPLRCEHHACALYAGSSLRHAARHHRPAALPPAASTPARCARCSPSPASPFCWLLPWPARSRAQPTLAGAVVQYLRRIAPAWLQVHRPATPLCCRRMQANDAWPPDPDTLSAPLPDGCIYRSWWCGGSCDGSLSDSKPITGSAPTDDPLGSACFSHLTCYLDGDPCHRCRCDAMLRLRARKVQCRSCC